MDENARTPAGVEVVAKLPDGTTVNVTEGVQALYDLVVQSLDWGSGFLTVEDAVPVAEIARVCGFKDMEEAVRYLKYAKEERERREQAAKPRQERTATFTIRL